VIRKLPEAVDSQADSLGAVLFRSVPAISVIIPVHGVADYLDRCLDSVLGQDGAEDDVEFIAVDDASADGSAAILAARHDPRLKVIRTASTVGPGRARERGAREATGDYLWFVDGDDELAAGGLAAVVAQLEKLRPEVLVIDYENIYADGRITPSDADLATPELTTIADSPVLLYVTMTMCNKVFRRDFLSGLGTPFGAGIYEDVPVALAGLLTASRIGVLDRVCYRYRRYRSGSFMGSVSDRHFDVFISYGTIFEQAYPMTAAVRATLFERMIRHYAFALPKVPRSRRRAFFGQMTRDFRRWRPAEFTFPPGPRGAGLRLVNRGTFRTYRVLESLNRFRVALRRRRRA
jgi:CDP-glycerol glycerophosphotransferase